MTVRVLSWLFAAFLLAVSLNLIIYGIILISLGGSWYYAIAGLALLGVVALLLMRNGLAGLLYALIVAGTVVWSIPEAGLDLLALLPRLMAWIVVGLWFLMPWYRAAMKRKGHGELVAGASMVGVLLLAVSAFQKGEVIEADRVIAAEEATRDDWVRYGNADEGTRFSTLTQITPENVSELEEVWRARTGVPWEIKATPIQIGDSLYTCASGNIMLSVNAATGEENWKYNPGNTTTGSTWDDLGSIGNRFSRGCRGVAYYEASDDYTGICKTRIFTGTSDARLIAVNAETGEPCADFGENGEVDLRAGLGPHGPGDYFHTSVPLVAGDNIVLGGWVSDNQELGNPSGVLRAWSAIDGSFSWAFDVGRPGDPGFPEEGETFTRGTPNVWSITSYDPELDMVYAPTGNASPDYYGAKRRDFDEEINAAVVALNGSTGELQWVFRTVYHDIWDYDVPSQPTLVDITKDGERIPALAQGTKQGELFLLDRRTGEPIWPETTCMDGSAATPMGECPVPQGASGNDWTSPVQPFSALPRFNVPRWEEDMWGMTPLDQLYCRIEFRKMRYEGHYTPPMPGSGRAGAEPTTGGTFQYPGNQGGYNWTSSSVDAENGIMVVQPMLLGNRIYQMTEAERMAMFGVRLSDEEGASRRAVVPDRPDLTGQGQWEADEPRYALTSRFMSYWKIPFTDIASETPCFEPPYGRLAAIDLNSNRLLWSRPIGKMTEIGPFGIKPGLPFEVGTPVYGGTATTRSGVIFQVGTFDSLLRAIDLSNGETLWEQKLPRSANATPITYMIDGRQYVVVSVPDDPEEGEPEVGSELIAYALPQ